MTQASIYSWLKRATAFARWNVGYRDSGTMNAEVMPVKCPELVRTVVGYCRRLVRLR